MVAGNRFGQNLSGAGALLLGAGVGIQIGRWAGGIRHVNRVLDFMS